MTKWPTFRGHFVVFLPPALYDAAAAAGYEMGYYRKQELIPPCPGPLKNRGVISDKVAKRRQM